jgi:prophage regulatory protein
MQSISSIGASPLFLRIRGVQRLTGLPKATIYAYAADGKFPKPVKLGKRSSAWIESEVAAWQMARIAERDKQPEAA